VQALPFALRSSGMIVGSVLLTTVGLLCVFRYTTPAAVLAPHTANDAWCPCSCYLLLEASKYVEEKSYTGLARAVGAKGGMAGALSQPQRLRNLLTTFPSVCVSRALSHVVCMCACLRVRVTLCAACVINAGAIFADLCNFLFLFGALTGYMIVIGDVLLPFTEWLGPLHQRWFIVGTQRDLGMHPES
jgi:hypothetical protein